MLEAVEHMDPPVLKYVVYEMRPLALALQWLL